MNCIFHYASQWRTYLSLAKLQQPPTGAVVPSVGWGGKSRAAAILMLVAIHQNAYYFQPYGNNHTDVYDLNREKGTQLYRKNTCSETIRMLQIYTLTRPSDAVGGFVLHTRHCIIRCKHFNSLLRIPTMAQAFLRRERTGVLRFKHSEMVLQR